MGAGLSTGPVHCLTAKSALVLEITGLPHTLIPATGALFAMQAIRQVPGRFRRKIPVRAIPIDTRGGLPEPGKAQSVTRPQKPEFPSDLLSGHSEIKISNGLGDTVRRNDTILYRGHGGQSACGAQTHPIEGSRNFRCPPEGRGSSGANSTPWNWTSMS
jgi:hypothetical protein